MTDPAFAVPAEAGTAVAFRARRNGFSKGPEADPRNAGLRECPALKRKRRTVPFFHTCSPDDLQGRGKESRRNGGDFAGKRPLDESTKAGCPGSIVRSFHGKEDEKGIACRKYSGRGGLAGRGAATPFSESVLPATKNKKGAPFFRGSLLRSEDKRTQAAARVRFGIIVW